MAAHMPYMCITGRCRQIGNFQQFRKLYCIYSRKLSSSTQIIINKCVYVPHKTCISLFTTDNVPKLTDEILKAKLGQIPPEKDSSDGDQKTDSSQDDKKKGKKESIWSGKNAWKIGLGFMSAYFVCLTGVVIWQCGTPELDPEGNEIKDEYSDLPAVIAYSKRAWKWAIRQKQTADPIVNGIDPHGYIMYRLYRDATRYMNNHHVKDLSCLNRDLSRVIFIDWDENSFQLQKENTLKLKRWKGNDDDRVLEDVANFLQTLAASGVEDVRPVLKYYSEFDDPLEKFKENQQKLREQQEIQARMLQEKEQQSKIKSFASGWFRR